MEEHNLSLRELYRTLELPGQNPLKDAHQALNSAVRAAYSMKDDVDVLAFLLKLNHQLALNEVSMQRVVGPGLPPVVTDANQFISTDCVRMI